MLGACWIALCIALHAKTHQCHEVSTCDDATVLLQSQRPRAVFPEGSTIEAATVGLNRDMHVSETNASFFAAAWTFVILCIFGGIIFMTSIKDRVLRDRRRLQIISPLFVLFYFANMTMVLPDSYDLVVEMGGDAAASGVLVGSPWALQTIAVVLSFQMTSWSWEVKKPLILGAVVVLSSSSLVYAIGANPQPAWNSMSRGVLLTVARLAIGPCMIFGASLRIAAQQVTLPSETMAWNVVFSLAVTLGTGLGPMVSPTVAWCIGLDTVRLRSAASSCTFAILWAFMGGFLLVCLPRDMTTLVDEFRKMQGNSKKNCEVVQLPKEQRRSIWWNGVWFNAERAFIIGALEAATVLILEKEFGYRAQFGGLVVGSTLLATLPVTLLLIHVKNCGMAIDTNILRCVVVLGALATVMLFPIPSLGVKLGAALILVTDCIVFSASFTANGLMDGFAMESCDDTPSFYSMANYIVTIQFIRILPRSLSPVLSRYLVSAQGRWMYASLQLVVSLLGCLTCFRNINTICSARSPKDDKMTLGTRPDMTK